MTLIPLKKKKNFALKSYTSTFLSLPPREIWQRLQLIAIGRTDVSATGTECQRESYMHTSTIAISSNQRIALDRHDAVRRRLLISSPSANQESSTTSYSDSWSSSENSTHSLARTLRRGAGGRSIYIRTRIGTTRILPSPSTLPVDACEERVYIRVYERRRHTKRNGAGQPLAGVTLKRKTKTIMVTSHRDIKFSLSGSLARTIAVLTSLASFLEETNLVS